MYLLGKKLVLALDAAGDWIANGPHTSLLIDWLISQEQRQNLPR
ncbi:MAG: hypothetical protein O2890_14795 [Cyanobacteria bacterium]|nr:hypothetical protein [Cyanobacteriota bacterium]